MVEQDSQPWVWRLVYGLTMGFAYVLQPAVHWLEGPRVCRSLAVGLPTIPPAVLVKLLLAATPQRCQRSERVLGSND